MNWTLHCGDLFDVLPTLPAGSIDACVTDPPYGIGFMGKTWDTFAPSEGESRIVPNRAIESDNPNLKGRTRGPASSPSAVEYDRSVAGQREFQAWTERWAREVVRVLKPGAHMLVCGAPRSFHRMACGLEDAGLEVRDCISWNFGQGFPKSLNFDDGWGTGLKPAWESITVARKPPSAPATCRDATDLELTPDIEFFALARKPFKGSIEKNRAKFGTGALNIDACRVGLSDDESPEDFRRVDGPDSKPRTGVAYAQDEWTKEKFKRATERGHDAGRWPANVLLDEEAAALLDQQSGELTSGGTPEFRSADKFRNTFGAFKGHETEHGIGGSTGGASRFFYVAKPSRAERDQGCENLTPKQRDESRKAGNPGGDNPRNRGLQLRGNYHPTVKPVELMRYLVRLVTPHGGTVLDPFTGSGTTGMACAYEGFTFIGIEREAEYVAIAERRIASCVPLFTSEGPA